MELRKPQYGNKEIYFTPDHNKTFENILKDFANGLLLFFYLFPVDILNDIVCQTMLYKMQ